MVNYILNFVFPYATSRTVRDSINNLLKLLCNNLNKDNSAIFFVAICGNAICSVSQCDISRVT